jgi:hypothetical protein
MREQRIAKVVEHVRLPGLQAQGLTKTGDRILALTGVAESHAQVAPGGREIGLAAQGMTITADGIIASAHFLEEHAEIKCRFEEAGVQLEGLQVLARRLQLLVSGLALQGLVESRQGRRRRERRRLVQ